MLRSITTRGKQASSDQSFKCRILASLFRDGVHPAALGQLLIADMVVDVLAASEASVMSSSKKGVLASPKRSFKLDSKQVPIMRCFSASAHPTADLGGYTEEMRVVKSEGFSMVTVENGKFAPGYVATLPGSVIHIALDVDFGRGPGQEVDGHPIFTELTLLRSYEHMGFANVSCFSGCTCGTTTIDTFTPSITYSVPHTIPLFTRDFVHGTDCVIEVRTTVARPHNNSCVATIVELVT